VRHRRDHRAVRVAAPEVDQSGYRVEGLLLERIGLAMQAAFYAAYGIAIVGTRGIGGWAMACLPLCFAISSLFRIVQIRADLRALPEELRRAVDHGDADDQRPR